MTDQISSPLPLPCGVVLANRLCKAAMSEGLADQKNDATERHVNLYRRWASSGAGLLLSGNVQVDRQHLERPGNIVLDAETDLSTLRAMAAAGTAGGSDFWVQLSHTGRQVLQVINPQPLAPSPVAIQVPPGLGLEFGLARAMTENEIATVIDQFAFAATQARAAGFTGVQLHAAHGYLLSQFLSPLSNQRKDRWGGSLENRARLLLEVIAAVRAEVGDDFPIGIKLNSSDFQKGGFTNAECVELVGLLNNTSLDLLELSGGSLEQPKVVGLVVKDEGEDAPRASTIQREAYFVEFAGAVRNVANMPVMVTGNFRSVEGMLSAFERGDVDLVGLGRPLISDPVTPARLLAGEWTTSLTPEAAINPFHLLPWFNVQIERLADGAEPDLTLAGEAAVAEFMAIEERAMHKLLEYRAAVES
jgi:2,4-dienoyl-CoA reductase-like NADH-dependent reductase (Old Yellow Enzyme family)